MLKNKTKIIAIFLALILLFSATYVFADNETSEIEPRVTSTCLLYTSNAADD